MDASPVEQTPGILVRSLLLALPLSLTVASAILAVQAVRAWGAAEAVHIADWLPTLVGLSMAAGSGLVGAWLGLAVWRAASQPLRLTVVLLPLSAAVLAFGTFVDSALAIRIASPSTYSGWSSSDNPVTTGGALAIGLAAAIMSTLFLVLLGSIYQGALQSNKGVRFDKKADEFDTLGALMATRSQRSRRQR